MTNTRGISVSKIFALAAPILTVFSLVWFMLSGSPSSMVEPVAAAAVVVSSPTATQVVPVVAPPTQTSEVIYAAPPTTAPQLQVVVAPTSAAIPIDRNKFYISQGTDMEIAGKWFSCGSTSLLMALADFDLLAATEDNRISLMNEVVPGWGYSVRSQLWYAGTAADMAEWARQHGLQATGFDDSRDVDALDQYLSEGKGAIIFIPKHIVYIAGRDANGDYIVGDPLDASTTRWSREHLKAVIRDFIIVWRDDAPGPRSVVGG